VSRQGGNLRSGEVGTAGRAGGLGDRAGAGGNLAIAAAQAAVAILAIAAARAAATLAIAVAQAAVAILAIAAARAAATLATAPAATMPVIDPRSFRAEAIASAAAISREAAEAARSAAVPIDSAVPARAPAATVARPALEEAAAEAEAAAASAAEAEAEASRRRWWRTLAWRWWWFTWWRSAMTGKRTKIHEEHGHEDSVRPHSALLMPDNRRTRCESAEAGGTAGTVATPRPSRTFDSPKQASDALVAAAAKFDVNALEQMFGPQFKTVVLSGESAQDRQRAAEFVAKAAEKAQVSIDPKTRTRALLLVGNDDWPFPIPIVKRGAKWSFDTAAGKQGDPPSTRRRQ
jgi:hypothetical protein